jgi:hypothetical protein
MATELRYGPVDASAFSAGLRVRMQVNADLPPPGPDYLQGLNVCMDVIDVGLLTCTSPGNRSSLGGWAVLESVPAESTASQPAVDIRFIYIDVEPANIGRYFGAIIDDVVIEGLGASVVPTPGTPEPVPAADQIYLPLVLAGSPGKPPAVPTMSSQGVSIQFAAGIGSDGSLDQPGDVFPYGSRRLVARIRYVGQVPGDSLRWSWRRNGEALDFAGPDGELVLPADAGQVDAVLTEPDDGPLRLGAYEVRVLRGSNVQPAAMAVASVQRTAAAHPMPVTEVLIKRADLARLGLGASRSATSAAAPRSRPHGPPPASRSVMAGAQ